MKDGAGTKEADANRDSADAPVVSRAPNDVPRDGVAVNNECSTSEVERSALGATDVVTGVTNSDERFGVTRRTGSTEVIVNGGGSVTSGPVAGQADRSASVPAGTPTSVPAGTIEGLVAEPLSAGPVDRIRSERGGGGGGGRRFEFRSGCGR